MKKSLIIAGLLTCFATAHADGYDYLVIKQLDGTQQSMPVTGLTITFTDDQLTAKNSEGTTSFNLSTLSSMYFSETGQSGISEAYANDATTLRVVGRTLKVSAPAGSQVVVANVGGMLIDHYTANGEAALTSLRPGIYIVKVNDKSSKIHIK